MANASDPETLRKLEQLAGEGKLVAYFGYGSLVNRLTHRTPVLHAMRASIEGFSRSWQERPDADDQPIALLSAAPDNSASRPLQGLLVFDTTEHLPKVDEREAGYDRLTLSADMLHLHETGFDPSGVPLYVYSARQPARPDVPHHILQSYLDAVLQGYLHQYGEDGMSGFITATRRFDTPVLLDRQQPRYPRAVVLSDYERGLIDRATASLARIKA